MNVRFVIGGSLIAGAALAALASVAVRPSPRAPESLRAEVERTVPAASSLLEVREGEGFVGSPTGILAGAAASRSSAGGHAVAATAPPIASRPFHLQARGAKRSVDVSLVGAAAKEAALEHGVAVYRGIYDGVDALAVPDSEKLELLYVAQRRPPRALSLAIDLGPRESLREEPTTHAALVVDARGSARARIGAPRAIDAHGLTRSGTYAIAGGELRIELDWEGLTAPVVIDPTFTLPFWSILDDPRVPGGAIYDATLQSRESHAAFDSTRGRLVAVRPVRTRLATDTLFLFGDATNMLDLPTRQILPTPRTSGLGEPVASGAALADWQRGYDLETETWEWDGSKWSVIDSARLPGLVDPALGFDGARGKTVLYGGAPQKYLCQQQATPYTFRDTPLECSAPLTDATATWEYDGASWTPKRIAGSPPPRIRASLAWMPSIGKMVLFGGRAFGSLEPVLVSGLTAPPYPEPLTEGLLSDTWEYDGESWTQVPTGSLPDGREGAQLTYDAARGVLVLIGGHAASDVAPDIDRLAIWEFDGTDWSEKVAAGDSTLPPSLATRHAASSFYNPVRQRTTILGGAADLLDFCALTSSQIASALAAAQASTDPTAMTALQQTGCLGGFVHDAWEWDGRSLVKVSDVVFGGVLDGVPVFEQASGDPAWSASASATAPDGGPLPGLATVLLPYRYDERPDHFGLRTQLERAHQSDAGADPPAFTVVGSLSRAPGAGVSPLFAAAVHPEVFFDATRAVATILAPGTAAVYETDGATWTDRTPGRTPFSSGANDFLAMAWDTVNSRIIAFDPRDASTWSHTDAGGWQPVPAGGTLSPWPLGPRIHSKQDLSRMTSDATGDPLAVVAQQMPKMTFDRGRGRAVMLYAGALWEFDGAAWASHPLPPTWSNACPAATFLRFDGARGISVAFGCNVPADTWAWDGAKWTGPGPTPFTALVARNDGILNQPQTTTDWMVVLPYWFGSLQLAAAHPDAAFESAALGGVSTFDADGTLKTWNGASWVSGTQVPSGMFCLQSLWERSLTGTPGPSITNAAANSLESDPTVWLGRFNLPMCFSPPVIEDAAHGRIVAFRDGPRGMLELPLDPPATQRAWRNVLLGTEGAFPGSTEYFGTVQVNPYPYELMAPEMFNLLTQSDPATRTGEFGGEYQYTSPGYTFLESSTAPERTVQNLWWPYQIVVDPTTNRVRLVTTRGMVWELTGEDVHGLGDACTSDLDCGEGGCGSEGVCCDKGQLCTAVECMTCKGATPGTCAPIPAGQPDVEGRCGTGPCAGSCSGAPAPCVYQPTLPCGTPSNCAAGVVQAGGHCSPVDSTCVDVGALVPACPISNGAPDLSSPCIPPAVTCAGGLGCASGGTSCTSTCSTRADCVSRYQTCATGGVCGGDSVAQAAAAAGVQPATALPPPMRAPAEIAGLLADAGFVPDDAGIFAFNTVPGYPISFAFDPGLQSPQIAFRNCTDFIGSCVARNHAVDPCVAAASRCVTPTPWLGDPSGGDCCPEACLLAYFSARKTMLEADAIMTVISSNCYLPGADAGIDSASTEGAGNP